MEQTALRPKPMPGRQPGGGHRFGIRRRLGAGRKSGAGRGSGPSGGSGAGGGPGAGRRPHAARKRGRRLRTLLFGLLVSTVLVLSGVGLGTVSATVIGMSKLAELQKAAGPPGAGPGAPGAPEAPGGPSAPTAPKPSPPAKPPQPDTGSTGGTGKGQSTARPTLGVEAVDAPGGPGALLVGVHSPGPGFTAGLVRGDVLLAFGRTRIGSAKALAGAVADARPGRNVTLTVRHENGDRQILSVTPGFVT
ncbi:PDZ domain-containing protein [Streptomyces sp. NPDC050658]|uniref:PDZ domain-containing protein n=1 Tax=unclassified Streptomyces TaxID=2593676 RepID=UPI003420AF17